VFGCGVSGGSNTAGEQTGGLVPAAARLAMFTEIRQLIHTVDWPIRAALRRDYGHSYMSNGGESLHLGGHSCNTRVRCRMASRMCGQRLTAWAKICCALLRLLPA
jgi:hypothetical protein